MKAFRLELDDRAVTPSRAAAIEALAAVQQAEAADDALDAAFARRPKISVADKALAMELAYGTLRWRRRLDDVIAPHCRKGLPEPPLIDIIRVATYALVFLDVPAHATVSTAVEAARATKGEEAAAKFANAVLRAISAEAPALRARTAPPADAPLDALARWHSFPDWMVAAFATAAGEGVEERGGADGRSGIVPLLEACNARPPLTLRAAPGKRDELLAALGAAVDAPAARAGKWAPDAVVIEVPRGSVTALAGFREGRFAVQDEGAQLVTTLLGDLRGKTVLDACAAPGGKAIHAAQLGARVTAVDVSVKRLAKVQEAAKRLGAADRIESLAAEVTRNGITALEGRTFDAVLVDAPCSGTGIVRRKPDVKWLRKEGELPRMAERQAAILEGAARHLAPGGRLVYAVCSVLPVEGEHVVASFLERTPGLTLLPPPAAFARGRFFRASPDRHGTDGFFAAIAERR